MASVSNINSNTNTTSEVQKKPAKKKSITEEEVKSKIAAKFGKKIGEKPKVEISQKAKDAAAGESAEGKDKIVMSKEEFDNKVSDIKNNDPNSSVTRSKLKDLLKTGAFSFNEKESAALREILKKS